MNVSGPPINLQRVFDGIVVASTAMAVCILIGWLVPTTTGYRDAVLTALFLTALLTGTAILRYLMTRDLLDPLVLFSAGLAWYFGLHTLWMATATHSVAVQHQVFGTFVPYLARGLVLLGLGYVALLMVFASYRARPSPDRAQRVYSDRALLLVFVCGMAMNVVLAASGGFTKQYQNTGPGARATGNLQTYRTLAFTSLVAFVICTAQHYRTGGSRKTMWFMLIVQIILAFAAAQKSFAFQAIFAWLAARNYTATRLPVKAVAVAALLGMFVVTPLIQASRTAEQFKTTGDQHTLASVRATGVAVPTRVAHYLAGLPGSALAGWNILNNRTDGAESLALSIGDTPGQYPYLNGRHLPLVLEAPIPHMIWPSKPSYDPSSYFSATYAGETAAKGFGLTYAPTLPGDFYINFGWLGVVAGMGLMGLILRLVIVARDSLAGGFGIAVYVATMLSIVLVEQDMTDIGITVFLQLIAVGVTYGELRLANRFIPAVPSQLADRVSLSGTPCALGEPQRQHTLPP